MEMVTTYSKIAVGDLVRRKMEGDLFRVTCLSHIAGGMVRVDLCPSGKIARRTEQFENKPVILVHRPWPQGRTEESWRTLIAHEAGHVAEFGVHATEDQIRELRDLIETYDLGKPQAPRNALPFAKAPARSTRNTYKRRA